MATAITRNEVEFILEEDRKLDADEQTIFTIKPLSARDYAVVQDRLKLKGSGDDMSIENASSYNLDVLKLGLKGWSNFKNAEGNEIVFKPKDVLGSIDYVNVDYRYEIATAIIELSVMGEVQIKN